MSSFVHVFRNSLSNGTTTLPNASNAVRSSHVKMFPALARNYATARARYAPVRRQPAVFFRAQKVTEKCGVTVLQWLCCACETRQLPRLQQWCVITSSSSICSRYCKKTSGSGSVQFSSHVYRRGLAPALQDAHVIKLSDRCTARAPRYTMPRNDAPVGGVSKM